MYNTILAATDGSEQSQRAIENAAISAEKWGANLTILTVASPPPAIYTNVAGFTGNYSVDYEKAIMSYHLSLLESAKKTLKEKHPEVKVTTRIKKGNAATKILEASEDVEVDLIFIGSRGLGGLTGWLLGSVSSQVVNCCKKPILIVK